MAAIRHLFSFRRSDTHDFGIDSANLSEMGSDQNIEAFQKLGQRQQALDIGIGGFIQQLTGLQDTVSQMAELRRELNQTCEDHRRLALANVSLIQERDRLQRGYDDKAALLEETSTDLSALRVEFEDQRRAAQKVQGDLQRLEQKHHLLGVAHREGEEQLARALADGAALQEEGEHLRSEIAALQDLTETYGSRIAELTGRYNDTNAKLILATNRGELAESSLQERMEEISGLREQLDLTVQERDKAVQFGHRKDQEAIQAKGEATRMFQQGQQERKAREAELNLLRSELDNSRASLRMLEEVNATARGENEKLLINTRQLEEAKAQLELQLERAEARVARAAAKLETTAMAKAQIEQSRLTMSSRIETLTQSLLEQEADVKRLENDVVRLTLQNERGTALAEDTSETLQGRIFELERELASQRNETAFCASQLAELKRGDA